MSHFKENLRDLCNKHSIENGSDTPDYILAMYIMDCLAAFNKATCYREAHYGRDSPATKIMMSTEEIRIPVVIADMERY